MVIHCHHSHTPANMTCPEGTTGDKCDTCVDGYYGDPKKGTQCKKCDCNGNIDLTDTGNCNTVSGRCLKCINNTAGARCHRCIGGYYGDAINGKCIRE